MCTNFDPLFSHFRTSGDSGDSRNLRNLTFRHFGEKVNFHGFPMSPLWRNLDTKCRNLRKHVSTCVTKCRLNGQNVTTKRHFFDTFFNFGHQKSTLNSLFEKVAHFFQKRALEHN